MESRNLEEAFRARFEGLVARDPKLTFEWRRVPSAVWGERVDLVCAPGSNKEIWASIREASIAVGDASTHVDIEDFGRGLSCEELAGEAVQLLHEKLRAAGISQ